MSKRDNTPKWGNDSRLNFMQGMTDAFGQTYADMALAEDAFIPCTATYDTVIKRHTLTPTQVGLVLPEVFIVRFAAAAAYSEGDKVYIGGVDYSPAYTDGDNAVTAGTWQTGAVVGLACSKAAKKAFVGMGFGLQWSTIAKSIPLSDVSDTAITHRNSFRGKNLGAVVTEAQKAAIRNGSFDDLWLGDYWVIGGKIWRIADFNYWLNCGDNAVPPSHLIIMPDNVLYNHVMNDTNITTGGYVGSKMYTDGLAQAKTLAASAFPSMVLSHRTYLVNAVTNGKPAGGAWYDSTLELPNEIMMYGSHVFMPRSDGVTIVASYTIDNSQLALMAAHPRFIKTGETYWLRDVVSATHFAYVTAGGIASCNSASDSLEVRPVFAIG